MRLRPFHRAFVVLTFASLCALSLAAAQKSDPANTLLQAAIHKQIVDGDLKEAIKMYNEILNKYSANDGVAAKALLHLAEAQHKLGGSEEQKTYVRLINKYGKQPEAAEARRRLDTLRIPVSSKTPVNALVLLDNVIGEPRHTFITPDGRSMSMRMSNGTVVIRDMVSGQSQRLMEEGGGAEAAMISPDGRRVAEVVFHGVYQLWVRENKPDSKPTVVLDGNTQGVPHLAAWSKDSKSILLTLAKTDRTWEIAWLPVADGKARTIISLGWRIRDDRPTLSPDGRYIAYSALAHNPSKALDPQDRPAPPDIADQSIYVIALDGSSLKEVVIGANVNEGPVWTGDGSHILFLSNRSGSFGLYSIPIFNGEALGKPSPVKGAPITARIVPVGMTEGGNYYYIKKRTGTDVFQRSMAEDGKVDGRAVHVSYNATDHNTGPAWSPDGRRIAFMRQRVGASGFDLVVHDVGNDSESTFAAIRGAELNREAPVWMHDSKGILVQTSQGIQRVDLESKKFSVVTSKPFVPPSLAISPNDRTLYFIAPPATGPLRTKSGNLATIATLDLITGEQTNVWTAPESATLEGIVLSPDGHSLAISIVTKTCKQRGPRGGCNTDLESLSGIIGRVNVDGTGYTQLTSTLLEGQARAFRPMTLRVAAWGPDSHAILYMDESQRLMRIPASGGTPEFSGLSLIDFNGFSLKPTDGSQIVYGDRSENELWKLDNLSSFLKNEQ